MAQIISLVLMFCGVSAHAKWFSSFEEASSSFKVEQTLASMDLEKKVGQLFIFGFGGKNFSAKTNALLRDTMPGAVIIFARNIKTARQIATLNRSLQSASMQHSGVPLLIALDQEGGDVTRIRFNPPLPSALALGQSEDETLSERMGYLVGKVLHSLGFNMNLAPVLDLSDPNNHSFIGTRSFGGNPRKVSKMTSAYAMGLEAAGILATGKHFPGHGNTSVDSHHGLPEKKEGLAELLSSDLMPFSLFMRQVQSPAILVAHVSYPRIDPTRTPATFSRPILNGVLRKQLKYNGLVVTDDIEMAAAAGVGNFEDRAVRAINAGADLIMIAWSVKAQKQAVAAVTKAVRSGRISQQTLNAAVRRILTAKEKYSSLKKPPAANLKTFRSVLKSNSIKDLTDTILEKNFYHSLSSLSENSFLWTNDPLIVVSTRKKFYSEFKSNSSIPSKWLRFKGKNSISQLKKFPDRYHFLFYVTGIHTAKAASRLPKSIKARTVVVNATTPGTLKGQKSFKSVVNIYSPHPAAGKLIAENVIRPKHHSRVLASESE